MRRAIRRGRVRRWRRRGCLPGCVLPLVGIILILGAIVIALL
jgi:hypothetical protein